MSYNFFDLGIKKDYIYQVLMYFTLAYPSGLPRSSEQLICSRKHLSCFLF